VQLLPELNEGGVERGVVELSRELVTRGIESVVISRGGRLVEQIEAEGGRHLPFDVAGKNLLTAPARVLGLRALLRRVQPDLLHARSRVPAWLAYLANRKLRLPLITTVHGFNSVNSYSRVMTFGDRVICVSTAIKDYIQHHYQVPEDKIVVIPRGVDLEFFDPQRLDEAFMAGFRAEHGLAGRFVVTAVGRITQLKDYETLLRAIAAVRRRVPEVLCLIVGGVRADKEGYYRELQALVARLELSAAVRFTGSQSRVPEIYALSDVVVSSSRKPESFGRSAAEALAMNVPVVASAHGGMLDIVRDGETGFLFAPGDAEALADGLLRCRAHGFADLRAYVERHFTLEQMTARTLEVYRSLTAEGPSQ
jgi:glycosyltransferase involved in cell wall biosynthesis